MPKEMGTMDSVELRSPIDAGNLSQELQPLSFL